jgi:aminoglycoside/choline kinase family phosphotransferase
MMIGNFLYDLASLVEDPYLSLPQMLKQKILDYYFSMNNWNLHLYYKYYKIQRLVQVLGAFAFLSIQKNKDFFIKQLKNSYPVLQDIILQLKNL